MNKQTIRIITGSIVLIFALVLTSGLAGAATIWVPEGGNQTIQQAVYNANDGDTIIVRDGTYTENVEVMNKQNLTIRSQNGSENCIVTANNTNESVFHLYSLWGELTRVNISGFTIQNATGQFDAGIYLTGAEHCTISDNIVTNNYRGIRLVYSSNNNTIMNNSVLYNYDSGIDIGDAYNELQSNNNTLTNNTVSFTTNSVGIRLEDSHNNTLTNNNANENNGTGIDLSHSNNNTITNNTANANDVAGIYLDDSQDNDFIGNTANANGYSTEYLRGGIVLGDSRYNNLTNNNATGNKDAGIVLLYYSDHNNLTNNTANANDGDGIYLLYADNNPLTDNIANANNGTGIFLRTSWYNNLTNNTANANNGTGIRLEPYYGEIMNNNTLVGNTANSNGNNGIYLYHADNNTLVGNTANSNNMNGIVLDYSDSNVLSANRARGHNDSGIKLNSADVNELIRNTVIDNHYGITIAYSANNTITCNLVYQNTEAGFYSIWWSINNTIADNNIIFNGAYNNDSGGWEWNFWTGEYQIYDVVAENNYWGTAVSEEIAASINESPGSVDYEPFLYEQSPCAPGLPALRVNKTVWNGTAWVKEVRDAYLNDTLRFNCTITNIGRVNLTQLRFWDILDCSLVFAGNATLKNATDVVVNDSIVLEGNYTFKPKVLHPDNLSWDPYNPLLTSPYEGFTELCPDTGHQRELWGWEDSNNDSRISTCDQIVLSGFGLLYSYHVEHVPYTLNVTNNETGESMYLESVQVDWGWWGPEVLGYEDYEEVNLSEPWAVSWLEVGWSEACFGRDWYELEEWNDTDADGNLSVNDTILLWSPGTDEDEDEEEDLWYTVTELAIDLVVSREWGVDDFVDPDGLLLEPGQSITFEYNATDIRCGWDTNTFVAKGLYEGNWTYSNEELVNVEVPPRPAVETNLTVWNGTAWAKEVTVLVNDTLNFSWLVHNNGTCCDLGNISGELTLANNETTVDNIEDLAPCSEVNGTLEVPALECGTYTVWWNVSADCEEADETVTAEDTVTVTVACPELEVNKTVWNGTAWVKAVNASINENVRFNCTITNTGNVNLTQLRFWDILDCSLVFAGNATLKNESGVILINLEETPYLHEQYNYTFKQRILHPNTTYGEDCDDEMPGYLWNPYDPLSSCFYKGALIVKSPTFDELCPEDKLHYLHGWNDTNNDGRVSACDQLWLESYEEWYHVDNVPYTLLVNDTATNESIYFDSVLDYEAISLSEPNGTEWTEVCWLEACCGGDGYTLETWTDNSSYPDYNLSANDTITLRNERTGNVTEYTVTELAKDLVVSMEWEVDHLINNSIPLAQSPPVSAFALETVVDTNRVTGPIAPLNLFVLEPNQTITIEYNATVIRCGVDINTFRAKGNPDVAQADVWYYSNEDIVTITVPCPGGYASDSGGTEQERFYTNETVYVTGSGFIPNSEVDIYITEDKHWVDGTHINSTIYAQKHNVTTDGNGSIIGVEIWPNPDPGEYDVVYDTNNNMKFDLGVDAAHNENDPGFIVLGREQREQVPALTPVGIAALIGLLSVIATSTLIRKRRR